LRRVLFLIVLSAVCGGRSIADRASSEWLIGPMQRFDPIGPAGNYTATAAIAAPAVISLDTRPEFMFGHLSTNGSFDGDDVFFLRSKRFGFATESVHREGEEGMRRYTLSMSNRYNATSAMGVTYTHHTSADPDLDDLSSLDLSIAVHPRPSIGALLVARNVGRTKFRGGHIERFFEGGVNTSHYGGRFGLFLHGRLDEGDSLDKGSLYAGGHLLVGRSLLLRGKIDDRSEIVTGAEVILSQFAVGFNYYTGDDGGDGGISYFRMFALR